MNQAIWRGWDLEPTWAVPDLVATRTPGALPGLDNGLPQFRGDARQEIVGIVAGARDHGEDVAVGDIEDDKAAGANGIEGAFGDGL